MDNKDIKIQYLESRIEFLNHYTEQQSKSHDNTLNILDSIIKTQKGLIIGVGIGYLIMLLYYIFGR